MVTTPAAEITPPPAETSPSPAPETVAIDTTKGWDSESYGWSEDTDDEGAAPEGDAAAAPETKTETPAAPKTETPPEPVAQPEGTKLTLTPEQRKELMDDPEIRADIERRAASRAGNLKQQEDARRAAEEKAESEWKAVETRYNELKAIPATERDTPEIRSWMARVEAAKATREAKAPDVEQVRTQVRTEELGDWNVAAARAFADHVKATPYYQHIPAAARTHLEAGTQEHGDKTWLQEYTESLQAGMLAWHKAQMTVAEQAIRNEMRAEGTEGNPPMMKGDNAPSLSAKEIERRHAEYGFDAGPDGIAITEADLATAKKTLGRY